jgi:hypothetical protein
MRYKGLLLAFVVAAAFVVTSSSLARHSHARHHRHGTHGLQVAALVGPTFVPDRPPDCTNGTAQHPGLGITGSSTLIYWSTTSGTATDGTLKITVTTSDSTTFDFSAALPAGDVILAVYAKGIDTGGNLYDYRPIGGVLSDTGLHPPATGNSGFAPISHILFCYGPVTSGPTGATGATGTTGSTTSTGPSAPGGVTPTAPSTSSPPVTPFTAPSKPKKKLKHHAPSKPRRKHAFTG